MASLTTKIRLSLTGTMVGTATDFGSAPTVPVGFDELISLASGTGANQADKIFADQRSTATNEDLDLAGVLTDPLGATLTFVKVKAIIVRAAVGNAGNVVVKPSGTNGFTGPFGAATHSLAIPPGGRIALLAPVSGWAVTPGTGDLLNIASSSGTSTYDIVVIGTSA